MMQTPARRRLLASPPWPAIGLLIFLLAAQAVSAQTVYQTASQLYLRGRQLQLSGKESEAKKIFASSLSTVEKALGSDPSNVDLISLQCWNLFRLDRHTDVVTIAQKILQSAKDFRIMETLAESLYFLDRNEEALQYFAKYVELAPPKDERMSSAYYYMGECYMRLKKYEHADIAFSTAVAMEKNMFYWWYRLGGVKELLSQYKRAYESYGKSLELNAGYAPAKEGRSRVKAKAGL
ncbi:MAG: tetratricopeptide repeat protein [Rectinemataceae bacterium]|nr:tetratricopeptide repeat protein [Rectinemataceae bacterium]